MSNIVKLREVLNVLENDNSLIPYEYTLESLLNVCKMLLEENNFSVRLRPKNATIVKNNKGLVKYYYDLLDRYYKNLTPYRDEYGDLKIAKDLINKLKKDYGLNQQQAIDMAIRLVETVFKYRKEFSFNLDVLISFRIFGQANMAWVTRTAIKLINKELNDPTKLMAIADKETEKLEKDNNLTFGYDNLEALANNIQKEK